VGGESWISVYQNSTPHTFPPHRRHIKGKGNIVCKNANHISAEKVKQHSNKRSQPTCHHCSITGHIRPKCPYLQAKKTKVQKELPIRPTSGTLPSTTFQALWHQQRQLKLVPANKSGQSKKNKSRHYKRKPQKPISNHGYEGLLSLMQCMLRGSSLIVFLAVSIKLPQFCKWMYESITQQAETFWPLTCVI
jgi:hypothetical protein